MKKSSTTFALDVAAPSAAVDKLAPWMDDDVAAVAGFWASFHGLSAFLHLVGVVALLVVTLLPIPLFASTCGSVKMVAKEPERVEVAIVKQVEPAPPPKPPEPEPVNPADEGKPAFAVVAAVDGPDLRACTVDTDCKKTEHCMNGACTKRAKKKAHHDDNIALLRALDDNTATGMLAVLGSSKDSGAFADLVEGRGVEGGALGGLVGGQAGETVGVGGLGLRGVGVGGGGTGEGIGTIGSGGGLASSKHAAVRLVLAGLDEAQRHRAEARLRICHVEHAIHGVASPDGSVTTDPDETCVARVLRPLAKQLSSPQQYEVAPK